jgi:[ribosomal protein S18]-alanine N-acetyltransferase
MSSPSLRIRNFRPSDFEEIYQIDQICFPEALAFSRGEFSLYLSPPNSIARLAEGMNGIAGFVLAWIEGWSGAHVLTLDVVPEMRKCKIGTRLMNRLHRELQKCGVAVSVLEVETQNTAAQRLYEKLGYEYQELLPGYYRGRQDAYRMKRVMAEPRP